MKRSQFFQQLRSQLEARRRELRQDISVEMAELQNLVDADGNHRDDERDECEAVSDELNALLVEHASDELAQIIHALRRLNDGVFGVCEDCRGKIPLARLQAMPYSTRCVECQECFEKDNITRFDEYYREWPEVIWPRQDRSSFKSRGTLSVW